MERMDIFDYEYARQAVNGGKIHHQRSGQYLFNMLPRPAVNVIAGTEWDPYEKDWDYYEILVWISAHLIFNGDGDVIKVVNQQETLWERKA